MYIYRRTKESGRKRQAKRTRNHSEASRSVQKCLKIMKILKIGSERSPRDKSGAFGFENMFWPLGNVARPEGVSKGSRGAPGGVYARMGIVGLVCHVYASGRSMYICRARIISFISIAPTNRNANRREIKANQGNQYVKHTQKRFKNP